MPGPRPVWPQEQTFPALSPPAKCPGRKLVTSLTLFLLCAFLRRAQLDLVRAKLRAKMV